MTNKTKFAIGVASAAAGALAHSIYQSSRESEITGEVVLVTGGSRGLGLALARRFAREGCRIAICARDAVELERARQDLREHDAEVQAVICDVSKRSEVEQMMREVTAHYGRIDILVNCAGLIQVGPIEEMVLEDFEDAMNAIFWGTVYPCLELLPAFQARNSGRIVNIASIGGMVSIPHMLPYSSAKNAVMGFSEGLRSELAGTGIAVTTIVPGLMRTGSYNAALFKGDQAAESEWFSLGASLPGISMSAERAARHIVNAVKRGDAEKVLTMAAAVLATAHAFAPGAIQDLLGLVKGLVLPKGVDNKHSRPGYALENLRSPKMRALLVLGRLAARRLNQRMA
jgi:short-subunit dehydrogenase